MHEEASGQQEAGGIKPQMASISLLSKPRARKPQGQAHGPGKERGLPVAGADGGHRPLHMDPERGRPLATLTQPISRSSLGRTGT